MPPKEEELWPIINHKIQKALQPFPEAHRTVMAAVFQDLDEYRGWRNPYPVSLAYPDRPIRHAPLKKVFSENKPEHLLESKRQTS